MIDMETIGGVHNLIMEQLDTNIWNTVSGLNLVEVAVAAVAHCPISS